MTKPTLYCFDLSPASRGVLLTIKALGLDVEYKSVSTLAKEHLSPEFVAINPQHTVPTLVDGGKAIWDSHAINAFLVTKYGKTDALYPKEAYARAVVDQRLHFDNSVLFSRFGAVVGPVFHKNSSELSAEALEKLAEALDFTEIFLGDNSYIAGNQLTIADFSCAGTLSSILALRLFEEDRFPKTNAWLKRLQQLPYYHEANGATVEKFHEAFKGKLAGNKAAAAAAQ